MPSRATEGKRTLTFSEMYEYDDVASGITVPVLLSRGQETEKTLAKVDTGASYCIFKRERGEALGLDIENGIPERASTVMDSFLTYGHSVSLSALGFRFEVLGYFAAEGGLGRNVLGQTRLDRENTPGHHGL